MTNVEEFSKFVYLEMEDAATLIDLSRTVGIYFVLAGHHDYMGRNREALPMKMRSKLTAAIIAMPLNDQKYLQHKIYKQRSAIR